MKINKLQLGQFTLDEALCQSIKSATKAFDQLWDDIEEMMRREREKERAPE